MYYSLKIFPAYWEVLEPDIKLIDRMTGFNNIEEALYHPDESIPLIRLHFANKVIDCNLIRNAGVMDCCSYDTRAYELAEMERTNGLNLMRIYHDYKDKIDKRRGSLTDAEIGYYEEKMRKIKQIITRILYTDNEIDSLVKRSKHNAHCAIKRAMKKLKVEAPLLHNYLSLTLTMGYWIKNQPDLDPDFELFIREANNSLAS